jgi:CHAD domain-containing protein
MLVEAMTKLARSRADSPFAEAIRPVEQALRQHRPVDLVDDALRRQVVAGLQSGRSRLAAWTAALRPGRTYRSLVAGLLRMARRSRRAYRLAYQTPAEEHFHAWRKRVKDLYYAARFLYLRRPTKLTPLIELLDRAAEDLGEEHDLALLATTLHAAPRQLGGVVPVALLLQLIGHRRSELRQGLRATGLDLYRRSPAQLARFLSKGGET